MEVLYLISSFESYFIFVVLVLVARSTFFFVAKLIYNSVCPLQLLFSRLLFKIYWIYWCEFIYIPYSVYKLLWRPCHLGTPALYR